MAGRRRPVNKRQSARKFRKQVAKTQKVNIARPTRGGGRM